MSQSWTHLYSLGLNMSQRKKVVPIFFSHAIPAMYSWYRDIFFLSWLQGIGSERNRKIALISFENTIPANRPTLKNLGRFYRFQEKYDISPVEKLIKITRLYFILFLLINKNHREKKPTFQFLLKCDFQQPFSDWNVLNDRHISVTIQLTFIADSVAFQSPFSDSLYRK